MVLIVSYDDRGAVGLVLNRESDVPISELLAGVKAARSRKDSAFEGGPVEPMSVLALLRTRNGPKGAQHVAGEIWAILDQDLLEDALKAHAGSDELRFYVGYAGWGPGQLETEMEAGAWRVIRGGADTVFDAKPESLWDRVVRGLDVTFAKVLLSTGAKRRVNPLGWLRKTETQARSNHPPRPRHRKAADPSYSNSASRPPPATDRSPCRECCPPMRASWCPWRRRR